MKQLRLSIISLVIILLLMPITIYAKRGDNDNDRKTIIGFIHSMPSNGFQGDWTMGD